MLSGYIKSQGKKNKGYHYEVVSYEEYQALHQRINTLLDELFEKLKSQPSGPPVAHPQNEPPKKMKIKKLDSVAH